MPTIEISVREKIAREPTGCAYIVCNNTDYVAKFDFDAEWDAYSVKTARFVWNCQYRDIVFSGSECAIPAIDDASAVGIGVFAGELRTTTPAMIMCLRSVLDGDGIPAPPSEDVYAQIMELLNETMESVSSDAERAETAAESATASAVQAETAALLAEGYADDAQSAKTDAETAKAYAETAEQDAVNAKQDALVSEENARFYMTAAETAKTAAQTADANASASATNATASAEDAEAWAVGKRGGVDVPSTDPAYNNNSKYHADESKAAKEDIEDSIEGVAQEATAQTALDKLTSIIGHLQTIVARHDEVRYYDVLPAQGTEGWTYITPDGTFHFHDGEYVQLSGSGDLNGFSLNLGTDNEVILSYVDPDDETITDTITMPTLQTINSIISSLGDIVTSLAKIAGQEE